MAVNSLKKYIPGLIFGKDIKLAHFNRRQCLLSNAYLVLCSISTFRINRRLWYNVRMTSLTYWRSNYNHLPPPATLASHVLTVASQDPVTTALISLEYSMQRTAASWAGPFPSGPPPPTLLSVELLMSKVFSRPSRLPDQTWIGS